MKKTIVIAAAAATGFIIYSLLKKKSTKFNSLQQSITEKHKNHHRTRVFANAKKKALS